MPIADPGPGDTGSPTDGAAQPGAQRYGRPGAGPAVTDPPISNPENPGGMGTPDRIAAVWHSSAGTLSTRMALGLAQSPLADHELHRASVMLARQFDLDPGWILPQTGPGSSDPTLRTYRDPATGGSLSFDSARRLLNPAEPGIIRRILGKEVKGTPGTGRPAEIRGHKTNRIQDAIPGVDRTRVAEAVRALAPIDGTHVPFSVALSAAIDVARNPNTDINLFAANLRITASATALPAEYQMAAAQLATENGIRLRSFGDVAGAVSILSGHPEDAARFAQADELSKLQGEIRHKGPAEPGPGDISSRPGNYIGDVSQLEAVQPGDATGQLAISTAQVEAAGLTGSKDWFSFVQEKQADYVTAAKVIEAQNSVPGTNTWLSHFTGFVLNRILGTGFQVVERFVFDPHLYGTAAHTIEHPISYILHGDTPAERVTDLQRFADARDIFFNRTTARDALMKQGVPGWFVDITGAIVGAYLDPVQYGLNALKVLRAQRLLTGLYDSGKEAEWAARVDQFLNHGVRKIGDLSNISVPEYLAREIARTKDPERFYGRAIGNFRTNFGEPGLNPMVASDIWTFAKGAKKAGATQEDIVAGIRGVLSAGYGIIPSNLGPLVEHIDALARVKTEAATARVLGENASLQGYDPLAAFNDSRKAIGALEPVTVLPKDAQAALGVLSDESLNTLASSYRSVELPHMSGPIGRATQFLRTSAVGEGDTSRILRSIVQQKPEQYGPRFTFNIEEPVAAVSDLGRALIGSELYSHQEIEKAKLLFAKTIDLSNPLREEQSAQVLARYDRLTQVRMAQRYGADEKMANRVVDRIESQFHSYHPELAFGAGLADEGLRTEVAGAQRRIMEIDHEEAAVEATLGLSVTARDSKMAALAAERKTLATRVEDIKHRGAVQTMRSPIVPSELKNVFPGMLDPVLLRQGYAEIMGTMKKWERAVSGHFTGAGVEIQSAEARMKAIDKILAGPDSAAKVGLAAEKTTLQARVAKLAAHEVRLPLRLATDKILDTAIQRTFLAIWKPLAVLRPAYILRVVGLEEQSRFLGTVGLTRRLQAGSTTGSLLSRMGMNTDHYLSIGAHLAEQPGQRGNSIEDALLYLQRHASSPSLVDAGFAAGDTLKGGALADVVASGARGLTAKERAQALEIVRRSAEPLKAIGIDVTKLKLFSPTVRRDATASAAAAAKARAFQAHIDAGELRFKVPSSLAREPMANTRVSQLTLASDEAARKELANLMPQSWGAIDRSDPQFFDYYFHTLAHQLGKDALGRRYLMGVGRGDDENKIVADALAWLTKPNSDGPTFARRLMGHSDYTPEDLAAQVRYGARYTQDLTALHPEVAKSALEGTLTLDALRGIPTDQLPLYVHGPLMNSQMLAHESPFKRGMESISNVIMTNRHNDLSRQPLYKSWYDRTYQALTAEGNARKGEQVTAENLAGYRETARQFALTQVRRTLLDYSHTGRLEEMTRFATVFLHPWLNFPIAWSRIIRQNPSMLGYALRLGHIAEQSGFLKKDPQTGELSVPVSWWAGAAPLLAMLTGTSMNKSELTGGGWSLSAPVSSFWLFANSTFPLPIGGTTLPVPTPSLSPPFQWAMQQFFNHDLEVPGDLKASYKSRVASWLFAYGDIGASGVTGLLPAWVRHAMEAADPAGFSDAVNFNATHFLQVQQAMGLKPDAGHARGQAQEFGLLRAFFGWVFPAAPRIEFPTQQLEQELQTLRDPVTGLGYAAGTDAFIKAHPNLRLLTLARTAWDTNNPDNPSPVPMPANAMVDQLLNTAGAKQFAVEHPAWVWAIIPAALGTGGTDIGDFFAQIAKGQRRVLTPTEFVQAGDVQSGWDAYFAARELLVSQQEALAAGGSSTTDAGYIKLKTEFDATIHSNAQLYPAWFTAYNTGQAQNMDPNVMTEAWHLSRDPIFQKTEVGQGLAQYMALHVKVRDQLAAAGLHTIGNLSYDKNAPVGGLTGENLVSTDNGMATKLGIAKEYTDGLAAIVKQFPQFDVAFRVFFRNDLQAVRTDGEKALAALPPGFIDSTLTPWQQHYDQLRVGPDIATTPGEKSAAYNTLNAYVNEAYNKFPDSQNPMLLKWGTSDPTTRANYLAGMVKLWPGFYNRFDKQTILGQADDNATEQLWAQYQQLHDLIGASEAANPNATNSTAGYKALDAWVLGEAQTNPAFAAQVTAANTWGSSFQKVRTQMFPLPSGSTDLSGPYWDAFLGSVHQVEQIANGAELSGIKDFNPKKRAAYVALRGSLQTYVDTLSSENSAFKAQWDYLEQHVSGSDPAISLFMPDSNRPLGGYAYALASQGGTP